jgi:hypothetical protein
VGEKWAKLQSRLSESVKPEGLRAAVSKPWGAALAAGCLGLVAGLVLGRRAKCGPHVALPAPAEATSTASGAGSATRPLNPVLERAVVLGIDALTDAIRDTVRERAGRCSDKPL